MIKKLLLFFMAILILIPTATIFADDGTNSTKNGVLCLPRMNESADCQNYGPNQAIKENEAKNLQIPLSPLYVVTPDESLKELPFYYAKVTAENAPIFETFDAAVAGEPIKRYLTTGLDYVSYSGFWFDEDGKKYYQIEVNEWMRASELSGGAVYSPFQGLKFETTPKYDFGWVLHAVYSQSAPSVNASPTTQAYTRWDVVPVFDVVENEGMKWYQIGLDEWVNIKNFSALHVLTTQPEGIPENNWIEINLETQTIAAYENSELIFASIISSGVDGFWTQPGVFQIYKEIDSELMTGAFEANKADYYYLEDVPWVLYYDQNRAIHGAYWHFNLGLAQSHGCINLAPGDAKFIFDWANIGSYVFVHDPSGKTPTDATLYGAGGA